MIPSPWPLARFVALGVVACAISVRAADSNDEFAQTLARLHAVMSDGVRASNEIYLAERFEPLSQGELQRRIDQWWRRFLSDAATRRFWSTQMPANLVATDRAVELIDPQSFLRTALAIRTAHQRLQSEGRATADLVRLEKFAADLARDFVRRGIVRSYQLRDSMWYEPVWVLAFQNGYCVDYTDWYYWTAQLMGLSADVVLASSPQADDYADHVLNLVAYADGGVELVEPQQLRGFGSLAWVLVQAKSDGKWKLERITPQDLSKRNATEVRGLGAFAIEALRHRQRAEQTLACVSRCMFNPTFSDSKKYSSAVRQATGALASFSGYGDVSSAGQIHYQAAVLLGTAELYRLGNQPDFAQKYANLGQGICREFSQESHPLPVRVDALFLLGRYLVEQARWAEPQNPARARQLLDAAEQSLRTAVELGAENRWKHFEYNFDLRMADIRNLRSQTPLVESSTSAVAAPDLAENGLALAHAENAVTAHRELREKLDLELGSDSPRLGSGIFNKRAFRKKADRFLRESYLTLGDVHRTRALMLEDIARREDPALDAVRRQAILKEAERHLGLALGCFLKRSQADDITGQPDRMRTHAARILLACISIELGQSDEARRHVAAAEKDADEIRQHTPDPLKLRQWERERSRLRAMLAETSAGAGKSK